MDTVGVERRMKWYQATAIFSVLFALLGFTYNVWRLEVTERNSSRREASFESLLQLAELEQLVFAAHYDQDAVAGNPRVGWVKVGLLVDLSESIDEPVERAALDLKETWSRRWSSMASERESTEAIVRSIDDMRASVKGALATLD
ncbi:hypothetical protein [Parahalioglobus pacificus]|uniref:Uncharacterized protein n=1 Tax=Parahalioglobus pacificus TaxID=930806 RepID=A0A918XHL9_9GAMM|nr:hypothetical protein [Halioglobus pacificus]GHD32672.1 hypothetical protein GCM10007053_17240 [Halioglobus pacificus]